MDDYERPFDFSISLGTWFHTEIRVSLFFLLLVPLLCFALQDTTYGLILGGVLFASVLWHEMAHIVAARQTGGSGERVLITPIGGMAYVQTAPTLSANIITPAAGPIVNLMICVLALPAVVQSDHIREALNPLYLPALQFEQHMLSDVLVLAFAINWVLFLINLVPVFPLDGGQILKSLLQAKTGREAATQIYLKAGTVIAWVILVAGLLLPGEPTKFLVCFGAIVLVLNREESFRSRMSVESYDESFMGYDFSEGYTSLERSAPLEEEDALEPEDENGGKLSAGPLQRWKERRLAEKQERDRQLEEEAEQQLDEILSKLHDKGMESLSEAERRVLEMASNRYREKRTQ